MTDRTDTTIDYSKEQLKSDALIELNKVSFRFQREEDIFSDLTWSLPAGRLCFITGPSGIGKTSLLKLIRRELIPSRGHIHLVGEDVTQSPQSKINEARRKIGWVSQAYDLIDELNIFENIALPLRVSGQSRDQYETDVVDLMNWVGLGKKMEAFPRSLSAGEQQRASIARAVITQPALLLADEPTGNVDPEMGQRLMRLFMELNRLGTSVIIATHDQNLLSQYKADIFRIKHGKLVEVSDV